MLSLGKILLAEQKDVSVCSSSGSSNLCMFLQSDTEREIQPDERREPRHCVRTHPHARTQHGCHHSTQRHPLPEAGGGGAHQKRRRALLNADQDFYRTAI